MGTDNATQESYRMERQTATKILVVDDDPELTRLLKRSLSRDGHEVQVVHEGRHGLRYAYTFQPGLVLLDILMPGMNGWDMLRRMRELSDVPVIVLSAIDNEDDKVRAFDLGADDYVTKPFGMQELKARIQAVLRRASMPPSQESHLLQFDGDQLVIDPSSHRLSVRGANVDLSPTEYRLLLYLAYNAGRVLNHNQILDNVWGPGYEASRGAVKVYIRRLRNKLEADACQPRYIITQRGAGYYLANI
jgi:two-component system KDP operon response regulator KdpE